MKNEIRLFVLSICLLPGLLSGQVKLIYDTDFGGDADDLGALAMLHHFVDREECELMAVMCWNLEEYAVSAIDAVNRFYGHPNIPIGSRQGEHTYVDWNHSKVIADHFPHERSWKNVPETTTLYRQLLSGAEDGEIVIVTVGPLANILYLLESEPDDISPLTGQALVRQKVKEFVIMGGQFPSGEKEWNFDGDMPGVTQQVLAQIPVPIVFSGFEVGQPIKTGEVFNELNKDTPLYVGFLHFTEFAPWFEREFNGRILDNSTFDQTAVLYAVRNGEGRYWKKVSGGYCLPDETGGNTWSQEGDKAHSYLRLLKTAEEMATVIEAFMMNRF
ncbi:MAG: nucleoside hydrolase [Bacteroidota bacterium]